LESSLESFVSWVFGELLSRLLGRMGIGGPVQDAAIQLAITSLVVLVCWFVISLPFSVLFKALSNSIHEACRHIGQLAATLRDMGAGRGGTIAGPMREYLDANRFRFFLTHQERLFSQRLRELAAQVSGIRDNAETAALTLSKDITELTQTADDLAGVDLDLQDVVVPDFEVEENLYAMRRSGITYMVVSLPILVALLVLNTWLLSRFFGEFTDEFIIYPHVSYAMGISLLFSVMEVSIGVGLFMKAHGVSRIGSMGPAVTWILVISLGCLALIEMYFYFLLGLQFYGVNIDQTNLMSGFELLEKAWMSPLGFVIVVSLALTGHQFVNGIFLFKESGDHHAYREGMEEYFRVSERYLENTDRIREGLPEVVKRLRAYAEFVEGQEGVERPRLADEAGNALGTLHATIEAADDRARKLYVEIEEHEARKLYYFHIFKFALFLGVAVLFISVQLPLLLNIPAVLGFPGPFLSLLSFVELAVVVAAGYSLGKKLDLVERVAVSGDGSDAEPIRGHDVHHGPASGAVIWASRVILAAVVSFSAILALYVQQKPNWVAFSLMLAAIGAAAWIGPSLRPVLYSVWIATKSFWISALMVVAFALAVAVWALIPALQLILTAIRVLAFPSLAGLPWLLDRMATLWRRIWNRSAASS